MLVRDGAAELLCSLLWPCWLSPSEALGAGAPHGDQRKVRMQRSLFLLRLHLAPLRGSACVVVFNSDASRRGCIQRQQSVPPAYGGEAVLLAGAHQSLTSRVPSAALDSRPLDAAAGTGRSRGWSCSRIGCAAGS